MGKPDEVNKKSLMLLSSEEAKSAAGFFSRTGTNYWMDQIEINEENGTKDFSIIIVTKRKFFLGINGQSQYILYKINNININDGNDGINFYLFSMFTGMIYIK